jgi:hypothetical protein
MTTESISEKIQRLQKTIERCDVQINDTRNSEEIIETFKKAKMEALRQLNEATNKNAANTTAPKTPNSPHLSGEIGTITPHFQSPQKDQETRKSEMQLPEPPVSPDKCGETGGLPPHFDAQNVPINALNPEMRHKTTAELPSGAANKPHLSGEIDIEKPVIFSTGTGPTLKVQIEWVGRNRPTIILGQGETLGRFITLLRDCAWSASASTGNWEKFCNSKSWRNLVLFYRAYAIFPRPSGEVLPTLEDIGKQYFVGEVRKMIWRLIQQEMDAAPVP